LDLIQIPKKSPIKSSKLKDSKKAKLEKKVKKSKKSKITSEDVALDNSRQWEKSKDKKLNYRVGAFDEEEIEKLKHALCRYCQENNLSEEGKKTLFIKI